MTKKPFAGDYVALLATFHAIHNEARPVLRENTDFIIHCDWGEELGPHTASEELRRRYMVWPSWVSEQHGPIGKEIFHHLQQAASITLNITVDGTPEACRRNTWLSRLPEEVNALQDLQELEIVLEDATTVLIDNQLDGVLDEQRCAQQKLDWAKAKSISLSKKLVAIQENNTHWSEQQASRSAARQLVASIQTTLSDTCRVETHCQVVGGQNQGSEDPMRTPVDRKRSIF